MHLDLSAVVGEPECRTDTECRTPEVCHTGSCVNACLVVRCGANAVCQTTVHDAICTCPPGYTGRPEEECRYSEYCKGTEALNQIWVLLWK